MAFNFFRKRSEDKSLLIFDKDHPTDDDIIFANEEKLADEKITGVERARLERLNSDLLAKKTNGKSEGHSQFDTLSQTPPSVAADDPVTSVKKSEDTDKADFAAPVDPVADTRKPEGIPSSKPVLVSREPITLITKPDPAGPIKSSNDIVAVESAPASDLVPLIKKSKDAVLTNSGEEKKVIVPDSPRPEFAPSPSEKANAKSAPSILHVGPGIKLKGEIGDCELVNLEGCIDGQVFAERLVISQIGIMNGTADVKNAQVDGAFEGTLTVTGRLTITSSGAVAGKVSYGELAIESGGVISGEIVSTAAARFSEPVQHPLIQSEPVPLLQDAKNHGPKIFPDEGLSSSLKAPRSLFSKHV